jgi:hypothetical protein
MMAMKMIVKLYIYYAIDKAAKSSNNNSMGWKEEGRVMMMMVKLYIYYANEKAQPRTA